MTAQRSTQGNNFGLLLIGLPLLALVAIWFVGDFVLPIDHWALVTWATPVCVLAYAVVWWLTFRNTKLNKQLGLTSVFLLFLWLMAGVPFMAWLNAWQDESAISVVERRVLNVTQTRRSCDVRLDQPIDQAWVVFLKRRDCEALIPSQSRLQLKLRTGRLGMIWMVDYAIVLSGSVTAPNTRGLAR